MDRNEVTVTVDARASTAAIRDKIRDMKERGYELVGPMPDLPDTPTVPEAMVLKFVHPEFVKVDGPGFSGPQAGIVIGGGTFENRGSGAGLSAGPL